MTAFRANGKNGTTRPAWTARSAEDSWKLSRPALGRVDSLIQTYRRHVVQTLEPLVHAHYPDLLAKPDNEYRKMVELSAKMTLVGQAATESAGRPFTPRRRRIATLFGGCCFLADSFIDDFGEEAAQEYLARFEILLTRGWFEVANDRERLFYVIVSRIFAARDIMRPHIRQAVLHLFEAQRRDVALRRIDAQEDLDRRRKLQQLRECARDRSGHAILVLATLLVPRASLAFLNVIFAAGDLIMHIDDHGDCYTDLRERRLTYMNQVKDPVRALRRIFRDDTDRLALGLQPGEGRDLMLAFLLRYYLTRLEKHKRQRARGASAWAVYE